VIGALGLEQRSQVMKYRMMIGKGASWDEALEFARARAAAAAAKRGTSG
jgi:hypothetical protein